MKPQIGSWEWWQRVILGAILVVALWEIMTVGSCIYCASQGLGPPLTPLEKSVRKNDLAAIRQQVQDGAKVDELDEQGSTALWCAVMNDEFESAELLLQLGANVNVKFQGRTMLHQLLDPHEYHEPNEARRIKWLRAHGAKP